MEPTLDLLTRVEVAKLLKVTTMTVFNYQKAGLPVLYMGPGRRPRYRLIDVMDWVHRSEKVSFKNK